MHVFIAVPAEALGTYTAAARLLGRALGPRAPAAPDLMALEFRDRRPRTIAEEFLERHGHPSLRRCIRDRQRERRSLPAKPPARKRIVHRPKKPEDTVDPTQN